MARTGGTFQILMKEMQHARPAAAFRPFASLLEMRVGTDKNVAVQLFKQIQAHAASAPEVGGGERPQGAKNGINHGLLLAFSFHVFLAEPSFKAWVCLSFIYFFLTTEMCCSLAKRPFGECTPGECDCDVVALLETGQ